MSLTSIVRALVNAQATPQQILAAVEAAEADSIAKSEIKREKARLKKQAQRNGKHALSLGTNGDSGGQTGTVGDRSGHLSLVPLDGFPHPSLIPLNPPLEVKTVGFQELRVDLPQEPIPNSEPAEKKKRKPKPEPAWPDTDPDNAAAYERRGSGFSLKENWICPDDWGEWAIAEFKWGVERILLEADKFREHFTSTDCKKPIRQDWRGTWRNWCRTASNGRTGNGLQKEHRTYA